MKKCLILKYYLDAAEGKKKKKKGSLEWDVSSLQLAGARWSGEAVATTGARSARSPPHCPAAHSRRCPALCAHVQRRGARVRPGWTRPSCATGPGLVRGTTRHSTARPNTQYSPCPRGPGRSGAFQERSPPAEDGVLAMASVQALSCYSPKRDG